MGDIDPITGLPKELGAWESITKGSQKIKVRCVKRRFGKTATLIEGLEKNIDIKEIAKKLKSKFACGGTAKEGVIELQGPNTKSKSDEKSIQRKHKERIKEELIRLGFAPDTITTQE